MQRTDDEELRVSLFVKDYFGDGFKPLAITKAEQAMIDSVVNYVDGSFGVMKYVLGLAIDFAMLAQSLANVDDWGNAFKADLSETDLFGRYELVTSRGTKTANTLSFRFNNTTYGIRKFEEKVVDLFNEMDRTGYPSAYVYNTGQWHKYKPELLLPAFRLSKSGKYILCQRLIDLGLSKLSKNRYFGREQQRVRLFEAIIQSYPRTDPAETSGAVFQGIAYGYTKADRPHLSLIVDKVRTGSSRQRRFGDIDGYYGIDLELSIEVKDYAITVDNVQKELGEFLTKVTTNKILGITFVRDVVGSAIDTILRAGAHAFTEARLLEEVSRWDWPKQNSALLGLFHYLSHVEQEPNSVRRLLKFVSELDPTHDCLVYFANP